MSTCEVSIGTHDNVSSKLYHPLNEHRKEFRQLLVRRGSVDDPLDCVLQHACLFENPPSFVNPVIGTIVQTFPLADIPLPY